MPNLLSNSEDGAVVSAFYGHESTSYLVYPQEDCEIVLYDSISDEEYVYNYDGKPVCPDFKVIHKPTGQVVNASGYDLE